MSYRRNIKILIVSIGALLTLTIISSLIWAFKVERQISERLGKGWFKAPLEFYSRPYEMRQGDFYDSEKLQDQFYLRGFQLSRNPRLAPKTYTWWNKDQCLANLSTPPEIEPHNCLAFRDNSNNLLSVVLFAENQKALNTLSGEPLQETSRLFLSPYLFAQYYGDNPILRQVLQLSDVPLYCSQAVTAIEDQNFLKHRGFSPVGFLRASLRNLLAGSYAQGGSTITQQLIKNYFLTPEKTIKRKLTEILMALVLEAKVEKEIILENYLNVIYMGQNGPFEIRGFGAAAHHYLNKDIAQLNLGECSLLAAILNNPGRYNPFRHPDRVLQRRAKVLKHMLELNMIDQNQHDLASASPIPKTKERVKVSPAPYYVDAVKKQLREMNFLPSYEERGLKVYTYLDLEKQSLAASALKSTVERIEENYKSTKKWAEEGVHLQGLLIHVDLESRGVISLIGGRSFAISQFNRAIDSARQVGSIFKPLVYLSALETTTPNGAPYTPLTLISDDPLEYRYEGQLWKPLNYSKQFHGSIPLFYALKNSINVATARLGIDVGLEHVMDVAQRMGVSSQLKPFPSLTLGAFEMKPIEVAKVYSNIANMGAVEDVYFIREIRSLNDEPLYTQVPSSNTMVAPDNVGKLVSMMKQTLETGTAKSSRKLGFHHIAAGKTGTTSDTKDSWFAGFTPRDLTLTWLGYDQNKISGLTGASGALPIWINYMKEVTKSYESLDFSWPPGLTPKIVDEEILHSLLPNEDKNELHEFELQM